MREILDAKDIFCLGTIALRGGGFIAEAKNKSVVFEITKRNRNEIVEMVIQKSLETMKANEFTV